ncbi:protein of unknown function [Rhodovastum atsumiense]|nr:protein of unknown function [Rhodovastum atsumiense]
MLLYSNIAKVYKRNNCIYCQSGRPGLLADYDDCE